MIHVATVHWQSDRWIDVQLGYLDRFLGGPYRAYAFLNEVPGDHADKFFYTSSEPIKDHATKLNLLGDVIRHAADDPSDPLLFVDGDAFPIAPLSPLVGEGLSRHKLIAVQRYENNGDTQPHPCFCITTVGFWAEIGGDWHRGHKWRNLQGQPVTDVGGNLLSALERAGVDWYPLRRTNRADVHPLFFALYGDEAHGHLAYHHGGGFHSSFGGRVSHVLAGEPEAWARSTTKVMARLPKRGPLGAIRRRYHPVARIRAQLREEAATLSEQVMERIERDEEFWRELI